MSNNTPDYKNNLAFPPRQLTDAEKILKELAYGHQSRNAYNDLINKAKKYFEELDK